MNAELQGKFDALLERLRRLESVVVAFSGGVDSAFVLAASVRAVGPERVLAVAKLLLGL